MSNASEYYVVRPGDSMWKIAVRYGMSLNELIDANPQIKNPALIYPNERIEIPSRTPQPSVPQPSVPQPEIPKPETPQPETAPQNSALENEVVNLVNMERERRGLSLLTVNPELTRVARYKSEDMESNNYFSHQSPVYGSPFDMLRQFGVNFSAAGENIARGQTTAQSVMDSWMNSEGHRANILSSTFTQIGVGYANSSGVPYWTQMFIRP